MDFQWPDRTEDAAPVWFLLPRNAPTAVLQSAEETDQRHQDLVGVARDVPVAEPQ
jgi:hypothetical protein